MSAVIIKIIRVSLCWAWDCAELFEYLWCLIFLRRLQIQCTLISSDKKTEASRGFVGFLPHTAKKLLLHFQISHERTTLCIMRTTCKYCLMTEIKVSMFPQGLGQRPKVANYGPEMSRSSPV